MAAFLRFETVSVILELSLIISLFRTGLWRSYKWLGVMVAIGLIRDVWLNRFDPDNESYQAIWAYTLVPYVISQVVCGSASHFRLARLYRGMGRFAGWLYLAAIVVAEASFLCVHHWIKDSLYASLVSCCLILEQSVATSMGGATLLVFLFLSRFPSPMKKLPSNLVVHLSLLTGFFTLTCVFQILMSMIVNEASVRILEQSFFALGDLCYLGWIVFFRRDGESREEWLPLDRETVDQIRGIDARAIEIAGQLKAACRS